MTCGPAPQQRLPLAPLMAAARADHSGLAEIVRRPRKSIVRYATEGIPLLAADQMACHLGMHPSSIWPEVVRPGHGGARVIYVVAFLLVGLILVLALIADPDDQTKHHTTPGLPADWRNRH